MAMTLADVRAKYPAYKDVPDDKLADALYNKYYASKDRRTFDARIGLKPFQNPLEGLGTVVQNLPASIAESAGGLGQLAAEGVQDIIDPQTQLGTIAPLKVTPGEPIADLVDPKKQPSAPTMPGGPPDAIAAGIRGVVDLLPQDTQDAIARKAAEGSLTAQLNVKKARDEQAKRPFDMEPGIASDVVQGLGSAVEMALPMAASVLVKNPAPLVAYFTARSAGSGYLEAVKEGTGTDTARAAAGLYAAAEAVTEAVAGKVFLQGGKTLIGSILKGIGVEGVTEGVTEAIQALVDSQVIGRDMTLEEALSRIKTATVGGAVAGGVISPITHVARGKGAETPSPAPVISPAPVTEPEEVSAPEERPALPAPGVMLALPPPEAFAPPPEQDVRRHPTSSPATPASVDDSDYQARIALQRTRQAETRELLQTAKETITPLGTFTVGEIGEDAAQRVRRLRVQAGRQVEGPVSIEEMARAKVPQKQIDAVIAARRPLTTGEALTALDIARAAKAKNIIVDDGNFAELAYRTTGQRNLRRMTQAQLNALRTTLDAMPAHAVPVTVPLADQSPFTDAQYGKAVDAVRNKGRYTAGAIKDATGLNNDKDVRAIRDAMVRRGQLVQRGPNDFRLYDVLGEERQAVPDDLPPGAFKEHVVKRIPVGKVRVRVDGKSIGTYGSGTEARGEVARQRQAKGPKTAIAIEPAADTAWGVLENRYDEQGNLLGQVVVDTHRDEGAARKTAEELNNPDVGARYEQTTVAPPGAAAPAQRRAPPPAVLAGRLPEIVKRLNQQAKDRKLPLLGVRIKLTAAVPDAGGMPTEGKYAARLITLAVEHLDPSMTTDQLADKLGQVMDHELIHALRAAGVLGPETTGWTSILRYAKRAKRPGSTETYFEWANRIYSRVPGYENMDTREEEAIAEAFRNWAKNKRNVVGQPATVFRQIVEWFKRLLNALPEDVFLSIETGRMVEDALRPPGSSQPRARTAAEMRDAAAGAAAAQAAQDENLARVRSREYLRARAQAREDRFGRSGPKTVLGTTPSRAYESGPLMDRVGVENVVSRYRTENGVGTGRLMTYLPEEPEYLKRVADAQQRATHDPGNNAVAKAYRALIDETRAMFKALRVDVNPWVEDGSPYASPEEMFADLATGQVNMRLSNEMFGEGADNPGHPLYAPSGYEATDGSVLTNNDLLRIVHDVYGHGQSGFGDTSRGAYNAYHEHARLLSPEARRALATEILAQRAWQDYGAHLRRRDGTVPRETDVDYLAPALKEFAEQKAFLLPEDLVGADPGLAIAAAADASESPRFMVAWHGTPHIFDKFSSDRIGTGEGAQAYGHGLYFAGKKEVAEYYRNMLSQDSVGPAERALKKERGNVENAVATAQREIDRLRALDLTPETGAAERDRRIATQEGIIRELETFKSTGKWTKGRLLQVDIPGDEDLMNWDAPLSEQPPKVKESIKPLQQARADDITAKTGLKTTEADIWEITGEDLYREISAQLGGDTAASKAFREAGIPGHRYIGHESQSTNYVIYDDSKIEVLDPDVRYSVFDDSLPGGRLYGDPNRSPGGVLSKPGTPSPAFTSDRPGNRFFGGEMAEEQLRMVREGDRGATMIYMTPEDYLVLAGEEANPEQEVYDAAIDAGYKFSTLPSLVIDGYAGNTRVSASDGAYAAVALSGTANSVPVVLYPRKRESLGLVTALEGRNGTRVPWPHEGRAENFPVERTGADADKFEDDFYDGLEEVAPGVSVSLRQVDDETYDLTVIQSDEKGKGRGSAAMRRLTKAADDNGITLTLSAAEDADGADGGLAYDDIISWYENFGFERTRGSDMERRPADRSIRYSINAPFGTRLPTTPPGPMRNIVQQRTEGVIGRFLKTLGRSKKSIAGLPSIFDARVVLQDKMLSWKEINEYAAEHGGSIDDLNDVYMQEQLYHGKVFDQIRDRELRLQLPLLEALKDAYDGNKKITPKEFEDYLYARHAPERNAYLRSRGAPSDNPSGMSDAEANTILDRFALDGRLPLLEYLAVYADAITADTTRTRVDGGLISEAAAAASPYRHYAPLRGFAEEELDPDENNQTRARSGKGFSVGGREDRTVTGRERKAGDILGHLFLQNTEAVIRAQKNEVALTGMRFIMDNPALEIGAILPGAPTRRVVGANGMIQEAGDPSYRQQPDIITAKWKGKEIVARLTEPRLARAIKSDYVSTSNDIVNALIAGAGKLNRYLAMINTSLNPEFIISNLARDLQTAGILAAQYDIPQFSRKVVGDAPKAMGGIREVLRSGTASTPWAQAFREMQEAGGTTEFLGIHDLETQVGRIRRSVTQTGLATTPRKALEYLGKVFKFVDDYNKVAENAFRLSAYANARAAGVSIPKAAYLAKNLTINFNKGGELKGFMNAMYLFYNASVQGSFVLMNGLKNKRVQKIVAGVVMGGIAMDILNRALTGDDDDNGVPDYDDIPDYVLETNFVLMDPLGILKSVGIERGYFALPMPYGFNAFFNLGRNLSAGFSGSPVRSPGKALVDSLLTFTDAFNPLGGAQSIWNFMAPTFADPAVELITNKDFAGNAIVPDRPTFGIPVPDSQKSWSNTGEIPKWVAEHLNRLTGGNEVRKGAIDVSPEVLQYGFDYATGATGKFVQRLWTLGTDTGPKALQGDFADIEIGDIPFARRVVGSVSGRNNTERYYTTAQEVETVAGEIELYQKSGRTGELQALIAAKPAEVRLIQAFDSGEKALQDLRKKLRDLRAIESMPLDKKREIEEQIKDQMDSIMTQLNRLYFDQKKTAGR